jgi:hypothetical protein
MLLDVKGLNDPVVWDKILFHGWFLFPKEKAQHDEMIFMRSKESVKNVNAGIICDSETSSVFTKLRAMKGVELLMYNTLHCNMRDALQTASREKKMSRNTTNNVMMKILDQRKRIIHPALYLYNDKELRIESVFKQL